MPACCEFIEVCSRMLNLDSPALCEIVLYLEDRATVFGKSRDTKEMRRVQTNQVIAR